MSKQEVEFARSCGCTTRTYLEESQIEAARAYNLRTPCVRCDPHVVLRLCLSQVRGSWQMWLLNGYSSVEPLRQEWRRRKSTWSRLQGARVGDVVHKARGAYLSLPGEDVEGELANLLRLVVEIVSPLTTPQGKSYVVQLGYPAMARHSGLIARLKLRIPGDLPVLITETKPVYQGKKRR